jgi:hypothetical protein
MRSNGVLQEVGRDEVHGAPPAATKDLAEVTA